MPVDRAQLASCSEACFLLRDDLVEKVDCPEHGNLSVPPPPLPPPPEIPATGTNVPIREWSSSSTILNRFSVL